MRSTITPWNMSIWLFVFCSLTNLSKESSQHKLTMWYYVKDFVENLLFVQEGEDESY